MQNFIFICLLRRVSWFLLFGNEVESLFVLRRGAAALRTTGELNGKTKQKI